MRHLVFYCRKSACFNVGAFALALVIVCPGNRHACADNASWAAQPTLQPTSLQTADTRSGGVIQQSYTYHSQGPAATTAAVPPAAPAGNWYGYGFPVQTYRWGWFGAGRYYPTVLWHTGYYGDQCRSGYRSGY